MDWTAHHDRLLGMTKKHYQLLANILRNHIVVEQLAGSQLGKEAELVAQLNTALKRDNPRFDYKRFKEACGL